LYWLQLQESLNEIIRIESQVSVVTRIKGAFSFINCIWFFSILGICISIGPTLCTVLRPVMVSLIRLSKRLFYEILLPIALRLHGWGVFEVMGYALCWVGVVEGYRIGDDAGVMVAATACLLCIPCAFYSTFLWSARIVKKLSTEVLLQLLDMWLVLIWIPCAIHFQSSLFGYGVVVALFTAIGLDARISPLLIQIGFRSEKSTLRCVIASFILIVMLVILRIMPMESTFIAPFVSPAGVIGNNVFFLAMLILSMASDKHHVLFNFAMIASLLSFNLVGHIFSIPGMATVSITYTVLFVLMSYGRFHLVNNYNIWILVLIVSISVWRASLFLHLHPEYITCLFGVY